MKGTSSASFIDKYSNINIALKEHFQAHQATGLSRIMLNESYAAVQYKYAIGTLRKNIRTKLEINKTTILSVLVQKFQQ